MSSDNYWSRILPQRLARRRALAVAASSLVTTSVLVACGGGQSAEPEEVSGLLVKPADTTKQAKRGGTVKLASSVAPLNWDPFILQNGASTRFPQLFSRLTMLKPGYLDDPSGEVVGDLAESWEFSPDGLTLTFKLRQTPWHQVAPVSGRMVDAQDIAATWKRFEAISPNRGTYANSFSKDSPIVSVTAIDNKTLSMKLAFPMVTLLALLTINVAGSLWILPKEVDGQYDPKQVAIGSGPFQLGEYDTAAAHYVFKRNPGYYDRNNPLIDSAEYFTTPEYATGLSQFKAGSLYTWNVRPPDVLATKSDVPELAMYQSDFTTAGNATMFGYKTTPGAIFRDERLRQAYAMSVDRDLVIDVFRDVTNLRNAGVPVETRWNTAIEANLFPGFWLDPKGKDFGPNAKYYQLNVSEAKKLVAAAGYPNGVDVVSTMVQETIYGTDYPKFIDVVEGMTSEAGFRYKRNVVSYNNEFIPRYYSTVQGDWDGIAYANLLPSNPGDPIEGMVIALSKSSSAWVGHDVSGKGDHSGDPYLEDQLAKARIERDVNKRRTIAYDLQRYLAQKAYVLRPPGAARGLTLWWPAVKNVNVYRGESIPNYYQWIDDTQPPLKRA